MLYNHPGTSSQSIQPHQGVTYCTIDTVAIYSPDDNQMIEILASRYVAATAAQSILDTQIHSFLVPESVYNPSRC
jgi:hypothetical protein